MLNAMSALQAEETATASPRSARGFNDNDNGNDEDKTTTTARTSPRGAGASTAETTATSMTRGRLCHTIPGARSALLGLPLFPQADGLGFAEVERLEEVIVGELPGRGHAP